MKDLKWPAVVVIISLLVVLGFLAYNGKDAAIVLTGVIAVLGALGFGYTFSKTSEIQQSTAKIDEATSTIKEQTNGRISQLVSLIEDKDREHRREMTAMADKLAMMTPPADRES